MQFFSICALCMFFNLRFKWHDIHFNILLKSSLVERRARVLFWKKVLTLFIKFTLKTIHSSFSYLDLSASKRFTCIKNMSQRVVSVGILNALCLRHLSLPITLCQPAVTLPIQFLYVIYHLCSSFAPDHKFQMEYYDWNRFSVWKHQLC